MQTEEIELAAVCCRVAVNYEEEDMPRDFPHRRGDMWDVVIDIDTGQIKDWPSGTKPLDLYMKICDSGSYLLVDKSGAVVRAFKNDYVPDFIPGEYGDYLDFKIDSTGLITNWREYCTPQNIEAYLGRKD